MIDLSKPSTWKKIEGVTFIFLGSFGLTTPFLSPIFPHITYSLPVKVIIMILSSLVLSYSVWRFKNA